MKEYPPCPECGSETYQRIAFDDVNRIIVGCDECMRFIDINDLDIEGITI